ncbi:MAG: CRISPR-associated endonuclease Cas1 [Syntrophorhabdaceae bacterium]|nr:CRISPR-associated endonuclease Cas1 [Syntrophorhabdaceae bacterium]
MVDVPPLCLLKLSFKVLSPIDNLPHFHGAHISALFRHLLKPYLPKIETLSSALIVPVPIEVGNNHFLEGDDFSVHITYPQPYHESIKSFINALLSGTEEKNFSETHFYPNKTIKLEYAKCRITGESIFNKSPDVLRYEWINSEIELLQDLNEFSMVFYTPLRLPRPKGIKEEGHRFCDEGFFFEPTGEINPMGHLLKAIENRLLKYKNRGFLETSVSFQKNDPPLNVSNGGLIWIDCPYGYEPTKTIGGVVGTIKINGTCSKEIAYALTLGQYIGIGKNTSFGFGAYIIPELDNVRKVRPAQREKTILERAVDVENLHNALMRLPNSSPGIDGISVSDVKKAGTSILEKLSSEVLSGTYVQGELKRYRLPKEDGKFRDIFIQCVSDRLIHKALSDYLAPIFDRLLLSSAWAYRKGLNRKGAAEALNLAIQQGYTEGIKADIATFFDSVNTEKLIYILRGVFPFDPVTETIESLLHHFNSKGINGLPQGSPLSPVLSNLYLTCFDRAMEKEGFKLIRYSDDFVILTKEGSSKEIIIDKIQKTLSRIDLKLKEEKIIEVKPNTPIRFLGYLISKDEIREVEKDDEGQRDEWLPVFKDDWTDGQPVYLTSLAKSVYSDGADLIVKTDDNTSENIPWSRISRLVVVGRAPVSGGVIYRAVKEEIPVSFIDILGRQRGSFYPEFTEMPDLSSLQAKFAKDETFTLSFAKEIISAKIHNSYVLLKRNGIDCEKIKELEKKVSEAANLDKLRGYEGNAAKIYFSEFAHLVSPFEFKGRTYHPPDGPVNVMLSLSYTFLYNRISSVLKNKGFNARLGFYHKGRGAHNALASDLLEELRHIGERIVLSLIHLKEITMDDFSVNKRNNIEIYRMAAEGFRKIIRRFEKTMSQKASYHGGEKMSYNAYLDEMADNLRRSFKLQIPYRALRID